jgi:hypothetical protein
MSGEVIIIFAAVRRTLDAADCLTGEQLKLDVSHLCVGTKMKEEKTKNDLLMMALCEQACKTCAK